MLGEIQRFRRRRLEIHSGGEGQKQREKSSWFWPPHLQKYDPRAKNHQEGLRRCFDQAARYRSFAGHSQAFGRGRAQDSYFIERKLYPNVDFYSGSSCARFGIPVEMFPVIFAIGRMPGWIANYKEIMEDPKSRICRPRQVYMGRTLNHYVPLEERK